MQVVRIVTITNILIYVITTGIYLLYITFIVVKNQPFVYPRIRFVQRARKPLALDEILLSEDIGSNLSSTGDDPRGSTGEFTCLKTCRHERATRRPLTEATVTSEITHRRNYTLYPLF